MKRVNFERAVVLRRKGALARLEAAYNEFKAAKEDKKAYTSSRNCKSHLHTGRSYNDECERMSKEIKRLKEKLSLAV